MIRLSDGRQYCLNVWTSDFLPLARYSWPYKKNTGEVPAKDVIPPVTEPVTIKLFTVAGSSTRRR